MSIYVAPRPAPAPVKAGPLGPGAGPLMTEPLLSNILGQSPQKRMRKASQLGREVPWIRRAEMVISDLCSTVEWHLEDENDVEIDDETPDQDARRIRSLIEKPYANVPIGKKYTRRDLWALTFRHMGLCGNAFWYLDGMDGLGIPSNTLYIRPDRMTPIEDAQGNLVAWALDAKNARGEGGTRLELGQVVQFMLQPPDEGHFGIGLVESAMLKIDITTGTDRHAVSVLAAGGRLAGIMSPKDGVIDDSAYHQLVNDARTIVEQPDAAKRLQIIRAPVDFTSTAMTMDDAKVVELMVQGRDDLLTLWGAPLAAIGGAAPVGLNSGASRKEDDAVLWQKANHPRLVTFTEAIQYQILDDIPAVALEFEIEEPEFDDDAPRYELLNKSLNTPLRNKERRALIGLDPFGDPALDDAVWMPITVAQAFTAPGEGGVILQAPVTAGAPQVPSTPEDRAAQMAGETAQGKASLHEGLVKLRTTVERTLIPRLRDAVTKVLAEQRHDVASWIRTHNDHVAANPKDRVWWNAEQQDRKMRAALAAPVVVMSQTISEHIGEVLQPVKATPLDAATRALTRGAARVTKINARTQDAIATFVSDGIAQGLSPAELADAIESGVVLDNGVPAFDEYRAELIARTELMDAYNGAALASYSDAGLTSVQAIDGTGDEECAARDGQVFPIDEADTIEDHPNGSLDWAPVIGEPISEE